MASLSQKKVGLLRYPGDLVLVLELGEKWSRGKSLKIASGLSLTRRLREFYLQLSTLLMKTKGKKSKSCYYIICITLCLEIATMEKGRQ